MEESNLHKKKPQLFVSDNIYDVQATGPTDVVVHLSALKVPLF